MEDILINWTPQETRVAVVENGAVQELHIERTLERGLVGNVYLGKVARVLPGMQSGLHRHRAGTGGLPACRGPAPERRESPRPSRRRTGTAPQAVPIERQVYEGQALTVQVIKDPIGTKGARLSTQISHRRRGCWCTCRRTTTSASRRRSVRPSCATRCARACRRCVAGRPCRTAASTRGGFILRTNAEDASDEELGDGHRLPAQDLERDPREVLEPAARQRCCTRT